METFNVLRRIGMAISLAVIAIVGIDVGATSENAYVGAAITCVLAGIFLSKSIGEVQANPPQKGIPMLFGRLINHLLPAGWYALPFRGKIFVDIVPVPGEEMSINWNIDIRTPDSHYNRIPFFIYFRVDDENPVQFIIAGNKDEVMKKIQSQIEEIVREWITSPNKGPKTWRQARQATEETLNTVLKSLFARDMDRINKIDTEIPTEILFKYFNPPASLEGKDLTEFQEKMEPWRAALANLQSRPDFANIRDAVQRRREIILKARNGQMAAGDINFRAVIAGMGVLVTRIGLSNIEPTGKTADGVDEVALATLTQEKETINAATTAIQGAQFVDEVKKMTDILGDPKEARRAVSVRRKFTEEKVAENQVSLSPDLTAAIKEISMAAINLLAGRKGGTQ
jgi:hypothetical protein